MKPSRNPRLLAYALSLVASFHALAQAPGTIDAPFNPAGIGGGAVVGPAPGGKVVMSGPGLYYQNGANFSLRAAIRLNGDGTPDNGFVLTSNAGEVDGHAISADGHVLLHGRFQAFNGHPTQYVVRLNDDGTPDTTFKFSAANFLGATGLIPLPDGGAFVGLTQGLIYKVKPDGSKDPAWTMDPTVPTLQLAIALQPSGKLLVVQNGTVFRLDATGKKDPTYANASFPGVIPDQRHVVVAPDGSLFVTSSTQSLDGGPLRTLAKLRPDGGADTSFKFANDGPSIGSRAITALALQLDGKLLVQGQAMSPANLFRVDAKGVIDATFTSAYANATYLGLDASGRALVYGSYTQISPQVIFRNGLFRLFNDGVPAVPIVTGPPLPLTVNAGEPATFTVSAAGAGTLSYQWQFNGKDIPGATANPFVIPATKGSDTGEYRVVVSNANGTVTSAPAQLTVISTPSITLQPSGFSALEGIASNLVAGVAGEQPLALQWFHDGAAVPGATAPTLAFPSLATSDAGNYALVASNAFGAATSQVARVVVYPVRPAWFVATNGTTAQTFANAANPLRPDTAFKVIPDAPRGVIVASPKGVERWNDAGQRVWTARYVEADFGVLNAAAVDAQGNTYVAGILHFTGTLGDLGMTNNSSVSGPNGHKQAFVAKLDPDGHGLWYQLYEAAGPAIWDIAATPEGDVVFVGNNGGKTGRSYLGTLSVFEDAYAASVAGRIAANGTPQWIRSFVQFTSNKSTCEMDSVAVDATGIYVSGLISFSVQLSPSIQVQGNGHFMTKLDANGTAQWGKLTGGTAGQGDPVALANGHLWLYLFRDRTLQHWTRDGVLTTNFLAHSTPNATVNSVRFLSVTGTGDAVLAGGAVGAITVGNNLLDVGLNRPQVWYGQWGPDAAFRNSRTIATTPASYAPTGGATVTYSAGAVDAAGNLYLAGGFNAAMRYMGTDVIVPPKGYLGDFATGGSWLAKSSASALLGPVITQQPIASVSLFTGDSIQIGVRATGTGTITYQWRKDGQPIAGATGQNLPISNVTVASSGNYDCVVSNENGSSISSPCAVTVAPPFFIRGEPQPQLVLLGGATLSGAGVDLVAIKPSALLGKTLSFVITNTTSARFPLGATFTATFTGNSGGGSYNFPPSGGLGLRQGGWIAASLIPESTGLRLQKFDVQDALFLGLSHGGGFDLHYEVAAADGCCATGTFGLAGGTATAAFSVQTSTFVPDGNYQWQKDGVDIPVATASKFSIATVTAGDQGVYRCVVTYKGYTEVSEPAALEVVTGSGQPPVLTFTPFAAGANGLTIPTWPSGFVLQHTTSLLPPDWTTIATTPPVTIPTSQPGEFFRLVPGP